MNQEPKTKNQEPIDLWFHEFDEGAIADHIETASLDTVELARHQRYLREQDRVRFAYTHHLKRQILASYLECNAADVLIEVDEHGKPHVDRFEFNMSHTDGAFAMVVATDVPVGVDVERSNRRTDFEAVAGRYFSDQEWPPDSDETDVRRRHFFDLWALKESYIKARGLGLKIPLKSFAFLGAFPEFKPQLDEVGQQDDWHFHLERKDHLHVAVACPESFIIVRQSVARFLTS